MPLPIEWSTANLDPTKAAVTYSAMQREIESHMDSLPKERRCFDVLIYSTLDQANEIMLRVMRSVEWVRFAQIDTAVAVLRVSDFAAASTEEVLRRWAENRRDLVTFTHKTAQEVLGKATP